MPKIRNPRRGSMQFWPRKRARRQYARIRNWAKSSEAKALGFAGYKAGMSHVSFMDADKNSPTRNMEVTVPVTIIECPPLKVAGIRFYTGDVYGKKAVSDYIAKTSDKDLARKINLPKKEKQEKPEIEKNALDCTILVYTQPKMTGIGKKKPEIFEMGIGGSVQEKIQYAKGVLGKEIRISEIFKAGQFIDTHSISKGKGIQGPVKRFGVSIRQHKAEKTKRGPATLGPWHPHHGNYRVPHQGQMGYNQRTQYSKWIVLIGNDSKQINQKGGFLHYGNIKNDYLLVKGSVDGPAKRIIRMSVARRPKQEMIPEINYISVRSKQ